MGITGNFVHHKVLEQNCSSSCAEKKKPRLVTIGGRCSYPKSEQVFNKRGAGSQIGADCPGSIFTSPLFCTVQNQHSQGTPGKLQPPKELPYIIKLHTSWTPNSLHIRPWTRIELSILPSLRNLVRLSGIRAASLMGM